MAGHRGLPLAVADGFASDEDVLVLPIAVDSDAVACKPIAVGEISLAETPEQGAAEGCCRW